MAVAAPGKPLTVAWCGDARAYVVARHGAVYKLTADHNLRRVFQGNRNRVTSWLGSAYSDAQVKSRCGHPAIESMSRDVEDDRRLLLASDGAYEPLEDSARNLTLYLAGTPSEAARDFAESAIAHAGSHADNATALVADLRTATARPEPTPTT
ncbi:PP2C family protein-serine/threonine phosphatase [Streptomyces bobili]|uniref:PP2C family protein-serine/threonine phosphatase n=1 Tax=Streptomyces bobili TaxID=67280 RepID=UPI003815DC04